MNPLLNTLKLTDTVIQIVDKHKKGQTYIIGTNISEKVLVAASIVEKLNKTCVFIGSDELKAINIYNDFLNYFPEETIYLPPKELLLYNVEAKSHENEYDRIRTLIRIQKQEFKILVLPIRALTDLIYDPKELVSKSFSVMPGMNIKLDNMIERIVDAGYKRETLVEGPGQFASRGGILDIFPISSEDPIRIEFFGDEIDGIRTFDPMTQRSLENINSIDILPAREIILDKTKKNNLASLLEIEMDLLSRETKSRLLEDVEKLKQNIYINGVDKYINLLATDKRNILESIDAGFLCIDEIDRFSETYTAISNEINEEIKNLFHGKKISSGMAELYNNETYSWMQLDRFNKVLFGNVERKGFGEGIYFDSRMIPAYKGDLKILKEDIKKWSEKEYIVKVVVGNTEKEKRLRELFEDSSKIETIVGNIYNGFEMPNEKIAIISEKTIFNLPSKKRERGYQGKNTQKISAFSDIKENDLIVHRAHGIGIYEGIEQLIVENIKKDYIKIRYKDNGILYIPTEQLDAVQKYIGSDDKKPKINKLGTNDWSNTKKKVKKSLEALAKGLVELYAKRESIKGHNYSEDSPWQKEFEEKFPYEETEDQLNSIEEIKADMQTDVPMDRILCGDVGYGKTEVAIRAMFKVVNDGYQVAYLVPTTVLAQQQYNNFIERFADYPIKIEMLSRFRSLSQQKVILKKIQKGSIDILIATHRMLSKDIDFKKIGMLVVDEEQRFGVKHKERIKENYPKIDVLTLTATPIPRTLHMSMVGIRDISVIEMPPKERYPVQTYVMEYDKDIIRNAIYKEIARNGQVFYLHNRVRDMDLKKAQLQKLVPEARIEISHGQMSERELENIMEDFENKEIDVLLCTTIIESGLDISNANTIIVEDAENFGLAQLYQLRGRVGRSDRHAYAYITYRKDKVLNENAEKRLNAIREFTEFGAGFKIALRDLEIRGAGNLLGPEQHGQMNTVGYEMYCKLLEEAVQDAKGEEKSIPSSEIKLEIKVSAYIDVTYVSDMEQKIEIYKRIAEIQSEEDKRDVIDELTDRYGDVPIETINLMELSFIKHLASYIGFSNIKQGRSDILFTYADTNSIDLRMIAKLGNELKNRIMFTPSAKPYITFKCQNLDANNVLENIKILLQLIIKLKSNS